MKFVLNEENGAWEPEWETEKAPVEGKRTKRPPTLLERFRGWCSLERILSVALLVACVLLGVRDGDATLPVLMAILLVPGMVFRLY